MTDHSVRSTQGAYTIHVSPGSLQRVGSITQGVAPSRRCCVALDVRIAPVHGPVVIDSLESAGYEVVVAPLVASETTKTMPAVESVHEMMVEGGLDRSDPVVAVGGGIVGDVAGFAAATYLRGVPVIQVPTTLLAQVDASVGGKTGVNLPLPGGGLGKNLIGSFWQPMAVIADPCVLTTMDAREYRCGLAECVKHGVIGDRGLLGWLQSNLDAVLAVDPDAVTALIDRAIAVKIALVEKDEREGGVRAHLNFGHTFGHAIEAHPGLEYRHGEAVSVGMVAASLLGQKLGHGDSDLHQRLIDLLGQCHLPVTLPEEASIDRLISLMSVDKKRHRGADRLIVPTLESVEIVTGPPQEAVRASWVAVLPSSGD